LWHLQKFLYVKYIILEFTFLYLPPPTTPGIVSTGIIFLFAYICTQYLHYIHPSTPFPHLLTPPNGTNPPLAGPFLPFSSPYI
jgi:hypothetical protein